MLVSVMQYREITGDSETATAEVERVLTEAQGLLEGELRRPLEQQSYTETLVLLSDPRTGVALAFPTVTPIVSVDGDLSHVNGVIYGATPTSSPFVDAFAGPPTTTTITYVAGFDPEEDDPTSRFYTPRQIVRDIAWCAKALLAPLDAPSTVMAGATSVSVGDVSVTFGDEQAPGEVGVRWSCGSLEWKRRSV